MAIYKIKAGQVITVNADEFVGIAGTIFYDDTGVLRLSDGVTPGGVPISTQGGGGSGNGYVGSRGYFGSQGYTGSQGAGYTGSQGATGFIGSLGFTGSLGYTGSIGYSGSTGFIGSQGSTGFVGSIGYIGSQGYTGSVGYTGSQGLKGDTGTFTGTVVTSIIAGTATSVSSTTGNVTIWASPETGTGLIVGQTSATINSPTINNAVFQETFSIGTQVFYTHPNGFSVNENFDITNLGSQQNFTGYHYTSGAGKDGVAFTLARTGNFTDGFGITGDAYNNNFVIGSETANTDYVFKTGIGMPFDVSGGTAIFTIRRDGTLVLANGSTIQDIPDDSNPQGVYINVNSNLTQFDTGGRTHIPNDLVIKYGGITFVDSTYQTTAWLGSVNQLSNSPYVLSLDNTGNLSLNAGYLNFSTSDGSQVSPPAVNARSVGSRVVLWDQYTLADNADYAIGIEIGATWFGIPQNNSGYKFKFYGGSTNVLTIDGTGAVTFADNTTQTTAWPGSTNTIYIVNPTSGPGDHFRSGVQADLTNGVSINTSIGTGNFGTNYAWKFGFDGSLTFPDNTVQTTAYSSSTVKALFSVTTSTASNGGGLSYSNGVFTFTPAVQYSLPTASTSTLGGVIVDGTTITINSGTISAASQAFQPNGVFNITATNTTTVLTSATSQNITVTGSATQTIQLPDATTLKNGWIYRINNNTNSASSLTVNNHSGGQVGTVPQGGDTQVILLDNSTANGSWDYHGWIPSNILMGSATLQLGSSAYTIGPFNSTLTIGTSTDNPTYNFGTGATLSGNTKTINIGTGGVSGSTTKIAIGSTSSTSTVTLNGITQIPLASVTGSTATNNAINLWNQGQIFSDGNLHIHSNSGQLWINALDGSDVAVNTQVSPTAGGLQVGGALKSHSRAFDWTSMIHGSPATGGITTGTILGNASYSNAGDGVQLTPNTTNQTGVVAWNVTGFDFSKDFAMEWSWFTSNSGTNPADGIWAFFGGSSNGGATQPNSLSNGAIALRYLTYTNLKTQWYNNGSTTGNAINFRAGVTYQGEWMTSRFMVRSVGSKRYAYVYTGVGGVCDNAIDITGWTAGGTWVGVGASTGGNSAGQLCCHISLDYL